MNGYSKSTIVALSTVVLLTPAALAAQDGSRFRVVIPYFEPLAGADTGFGEDASEELRDLISTLATHVAMSRNEIRDAAREFNLDLSDLGCTETIQLAAQLNVPVAICATYSETPERDWVVNATVRSVESGEDFVLDQIRVPRRDGDELAAQEIFSQFDRFNTQVRASAFCGQYAASQDWDSALRNCDAALALNPTATGTRFLRAQILRALERNGESLAEAAAVLDTDPYHEGALQLAGYLSAVAGDDESARDYYGRYLELNPGDAAIRMRIAYDLARAGDPVGAMDLVATGLEVDPESADLWDQYGGFAFRAGQDAQAAYRVANPGAEDLAPEAAQRYRQAAEAYGRVFDARGADMPVDRLRNVLRAYLQLGDMRAAMDASERFLAVHPQDATLWSLQADALFRADQLEDAMASLDTVLEIDPEYPNARLRQASWLMQARLVDDALVKLAELARVSEQQADQAALLAWNEGYVNGYEAEDYAYAVRIMMAAEQFPNVSETVANRLRFWHGHSLLHATIPEQEAATPESAEATLPKFQEALRLVTASGDYASSIGMDLQSQVVQPIQQYIDIQEAIIRRGGRG